MQHISVFLPAIMKKIEKAYVRRMSGVCENPCDIKDDISEPDLKDDISEPDLPPEPTSVKF